VLNTARVKPGSSVALFGAGGVGLSIIMGAHLAGAMSPIFIAAALAQQNAEALAGIALTQLVRPGAPVIYGGFTTNVDMRLGSPAFGTPEGAWALAVGAALWPAVSRQRQPAHQQGGRCPGRQRNGLDPLAGGLGAH
jgi:trimethylamine:corrinoid methyltransferase-like protein